MKSKKSEWTGLTLEQVFLLKSQGKTNQKTQTNLKSVRQIITENLFSYFNLILFVLAILLISIGSYENLFFVLILSLNTAIGIFQEIRARNTILKLSLLSEAKCFVIREGIEYSIPIDQLVLGDLMRVTLGKQIVSDGVIVEGKVSVNESNLTGESHAISKLEGDKVLSGSFIVSGEALIQTTAVGKDNFVEQLSAKVKHLSKPNSEILTSLKKLLKIIGIIIVPLGLMTFYNAFQTSPHDYLPDFLADTTMYQNALKKMAGAMVAMVPSGLFLLTTITFASSVVKLSKKQTLVQELYSIETLSRIDMVCLDKTGTITSGNLQVDRFEFTQTETNLKYQHKDIHNIIASMNSALNDQNPTAKALDTYFKEKKRLKVKEILPFDSSRKYSAVTFDEGTFAIGAAEMLIKAKNIKVKKEVETFASSGKRVLLLAKGGTIKNDKLIGDVTPIGYVLLDDTIRDSAQETLASFAKSGVAIKVISGDSAFTVGEVARRAGVAEADKILSLEDLGDDELIDRCENTTIFGRVSPVQKKLLIETFQKNGHKVAMIGDGVNDILALKQADCSVAMASGSEAAMNISHLVLLNSDFGSLPAVVLEGRQIMTNMQRSSVLYLVKTLYTILLTFILLFTSKIYPFEPLQMFVIETFIIGVPSFFIALEKNDTIMKGKFLTKVFQLVIPGSLLVIANLMAVYLFASFWPDITDGEISTVGIIAATFAYLLVLVNVAMPLNKRRTYIVLGALIASALSFGVFGSFFKLSTLTIPSWLLLFLLMETTYVIMSVFKKELIKFWP